MVSDLRTDFTPIFGPHHIVPPDISASSDERGACDDNAKMRKRLGFERVMVDPLSLPSSQVVRTKLCGVSASSTRLCPAKSRKYLTTATYPNERWGMEAHHLPVRVVAPKWSHSTRTPCLRIALAGLSVKHFANSEILMP